MPGPTRKLLAESLLDVFYHRPDFVLGVFQLLRCNTEVFRPSIQFIGLMHIHAITIRLTDLRLVVHCSTPLTGKRNRQSLPVKDGAKVPVTEVAVRILAEQFTLGICKTSV